MTTYLDTAPQFNDTSTIEWVKKLRINGIPAADYLEAFAAQNIAPDQQKAWIENTHISIGHQARHITQTGQRWLRLISAYGNPGHFEAKIVNYAFGTIRAEQDGATRKPKSPHQMGILALASVTTGG